MPQQKQNSLIAALFEKSFDFYENMNFSANNVAISQNSLSSISFQNEIQLKSIAADDPMLGFQIYEEYSVFIFKKRVLIYEADTLVVELEGSPDYSFVDFVIYLNYLLVWQADGEFLWVDLTSPASSNGYNDTLAADEDFLPAGVNIFSVTCFSGFLLFSRSDGNMIWTKAAITITPDAWAHWITGGAENELLSFSSSYYALGEAVFLGSYTYIFGVNFNSYIGQFVVVSNRVSITMKKYDPAPGQSAPVYFTQDAVYVGTKNLLKAYTVSTNALSTANFDTSELNFVNSTPNFPCMRSPQFAIKVSSSYGIFDTYYALVSKAVKIFSSGYLFYNGPSYYSLQENDDGSKELKYYMIDVAYKDMEEYSESPNPSFQDLFGDMSTTTMAELILGPANEPVSSMKLKIPGAIVAFDFDLFPQKIYVRKVTEGMMAEQYVEEATISEESYPYAVFLGQGPKQAFELTWYGKFLAGAMIIQ